MSEYLSPSEMSREQLEAIAVDALWSIPPSSVDAWRHTAPRFPGLWQSVAAVRRPRPMPRRVVEWRVPRVGETVLYPVAGVPGTTKAWVIVEESAS